MFVTDAELAQLEAKLPPLDDPARLHHVIELAWHLRQRDAMLARSLAREATDLLAGWPDEQRSLAEARLMLIEGEAQWLVGELEAASGLAEQALMEFEQQGDAIGTADALWLRAWIDVDRGAAGGDTQLAEAANAAREAGDPVRAGVLGAASELFAVFAQMSGADATPPTPHAAAPAEAVVPMAVAGWRHDLAGSRAFQAADFEHAISPLMQAFDAARITGQMRRAINLAANIGNAYASLNAHDSALEWMQRGLHLARPTGWPMSIGQCLMQTAQALLHVGRRNEALTMLDQALSALSHLQGARAYAVALECRGDLALDGGDYDTALDCFARLEARGNHLGQLDFHSGAQRGQAHALSSLDRPLEALAKAESALALARERGDSYNQIAALTVLALIHTRHALPDPAPMFGPNAALHFLRQAMTVAATIEGYSVPADLLDAVASEYAGVGDHARAYEVALRAGAARDAAHAQDGARRAAALEVKHRVEVARAEASYQRRLAAAEAMRTTVLRQSSATLEHLVSIGQEITTHLEASAVYRALDRHVHGLLDATLFAIYLIDADGDGLSCVFGMDAGRSMDMLRLSLTDPACEPARCVRERREFLAAGSPGSEQSATLSRLFAPLLIGERVIGAVTVQSLAADAYGERERLIFRSLCAYGAIALDNAAAYRQVAATLGKLSATQAQLVEKNAELEKAYAALEEVSLTDQLTGLRNRRFFLQNVDSEVGMSLRRYDDPLRSIEHEAGGPGKDLVFFMVDIDHFKEVNDRHGHAAGDAVLVQMKERLREVFRETDYLIRWGGEEFLVLARATHRDDAKLVAERIRKAVAQRSFTLGDGTELAKTCSIGFACFPFVPAEPRLLSWSEVVELADQALYLVKRSGRDGWAAIYSTSETQYDELFPRMIHHLDEALAGGEAHLVTNLANVQLAAGPKTRRLVTAA